MEIQIARLCKEYPYFFPTIEKAIMLGYSMPGTIYPSDVISDELCKGRLGYIRWPLVDHCVRQRLEIANLSGIENKIMKNGNNSCLHLEIHTPYGIFGVAKVKHPGELPHKAQYRQKYIDQVSVWDFLDALGTAPEYEPFTDQCRPFYIIVHSPNRDGTAPAAIHVGRPNEDQTSWSYCVSLSDILSKETLVEEIVKASEPIINEEQIAQRKRVRLKKSAN